MGLARSSVGELWQLNFNGTFFTTGSDWTGKTALIDRHRRAALTCSARDGIQDDAPSHRKVGERRAAVVGQRTKLRVGSGNVIRHRGECSASRTFDVIVILRSDRAENVRSRAGGVIGHNTVLQRSAAAMMNKARRHSSPCLMQRWNNSNKSSRPETQQRYKFHHLQRQHCFR